MAEPDISAQGVIADEIRAYERSPFGLYGRAESYRCDAERLEQMGESTGAEQYRLIAEALERHADESEREEGV